MPIFDNYQSLWKSLKQLGFGTSVAFSSKMPGGFIMKRAFIAFAVVGMLSPGVAWSDDILVNCPSSASTCTHTYRIPANRTDTFVGKCGGSDASTSCKPAAAYISCNNGGASNQCSCTNNDSDKSGSASVTVNC